ncbi:MAG: MFS transporter [Gammaproteobacteria bacterium]
MIRPQALTSWWRVAAAVVAGFAVALNIGKVPAALPELRESLGIDLLWSGAIVSAFSVLAALAGAVTGGFVQRFGAKRSALAGLAAGAAGACLGALTSALPLLLMARLIEGMGFIVAAVALPSLIARSASARDRPLALGIWGAFVPGGMGIMLFASPAVLALGGWRASWLAAGATIAVCAAVLACAFAPGAPERAAASGQPGLRIYAGDPGALRLAGCFAAYSAQFIALTSFLPTVLVAHHQISLAGAATMTATVVVANVAGNVGAGWLLRAGVSRRSLLSAAAAVMAFTALATFAEPTPLALRLAAAIAFAAVGGLIPGTLFAATSAYARSASGVAVLAGMLLQGSGLGQVAGPVVLAGIVQHFGQWHYAALLMIGASAVIIYLAWSLPDPRTPARTRADSQR